MEELFDMISELNFGKIFSELVCVVMIFLVFILFGCVVICFDLIIRLVNVVFCWVSGF